MHTSWHVFIATEYSNARLNVCIEHELEDCSAETISHLWDIDMDTIINIIRNNVHKPCFVEVSRKYRRNVTRYKRLSLAELIEELEDL